VGAAPSDVATGDLNQDSKPDIVASTSAGISVLLAVGDGTFQKSVDYEIGGSGGATAPAISDFNNDGKLDVIVLGPAGQFSLFQGNGDGTLQTAVHFSLPATHTGRCLAVADFNGDGIPDVAVGATAITQNVLDIFFGMGDGNFQAPKQFLFLGQPTSMVVTDFNGDGRQDVAFATTDSESEVAVFVNSGDGNFRPPIYFGSSNGFTTGIAAADFNNDGSTDIAVASTGFSGNVTIFYGNGATGTKGQATIVMAGPNNLLPVDFNGDGKPDLAVVEDGEIGLIFGAPSGAFRVAPGYAVSGTGKLAIADFNNDNVPDLVLANASASSVSVFFGQGGGRYQAAHGTSLNGEQALGPAGDYNKDGFDDLIFDSPAVELIPNNGKGGFGPPEIISTELLRTFPSGDFNHDGTLDLLALHLLDGSVYVFIGNGDGTFQPPVVTPSDVDTSVLAAGDFNHDGKLDVVTGNSFNNTISVLLGKGDGTFEPPVVTSTNLSLHRLVPGDFNNDGKLDLALDSASDTAIHIFLGNNDGTFQAPQSFPAGNSPYDMKAGDFNGDGNLDVVIWTPYFHTSTVDILFGNGDGSLQKPVVLLVDGAGQLVLADFNNDGNLDIETGAGIVLLGRGNGRFLSPVSYPAGNNARSSVVGDFNGDGALDLAFEGETTNFTLFTLFNLGGTRINLTSSQNPSHVGQLVVFTATVRPSMAIVAKSDPSGAITFRDGRSILATVPLLSGKAVFMTSTLSAGTHSITATYGGDADYDRNFSKVLKQQVNP